MYRQASRIKISHAMISIDIIFYMALKNSPDAKDPPSDQASITVRIARANVGGIFPNEQVDIMVAVARTVFSKHDGKIDSPEICKSIYRDYANECLGKGFIDESALRSFGADINNLSTLDTLLANEELNQKYPWLVSLTTVLNR